MSTATQYGEKNTSAQRGDGTVRRTTETKAAIKTSEFIAWVAAVVAIAVTAAVVGGSEGAANDPFNAFQALQLITFVTIGYLVSRGLAKSGSREYYDA